MLIELKKIAHGRARVARGTVVTVHDSPSRSPCFCPLLKLITATQFILPFSVMILGLLLSLVILGRRDQSHQRQSLMGKSFHL